MYFLRKLTFCRNDVELQDHNQFQWNSQSVKMKAIQRTPKVRQSMTVWNSHFTYRLSLTYNLWCKPFSSLKRLFSEVRWPLRLIYLNFRISKRDISSFHLGTSQFHLCISSFHICTLLNFILTFLYFYLRIFLFIF